MTRQGVSVYETRPDWPGAAFLAATGTPVSGIEPLPGDASARRYFRLSGADLLLMEDATDPVGFEGFLAVADHLRHLGLSAPEVKASDATHGLALIEDFGTRTYANALATGESEEALYALAVDALLALHGNPDGAAIARPLYDLAVHLEELDTFSHWFAPALCPDLDATAFAAEFRSLWAVALETVAERFDTIVLRDFHIDNLMLLDRPGVRACGLLDFQDAVLGPCEYDLVSLLQDARRDLTQGLEEAMLTRYIVGAPAHLGTGAEIRRRYALLGAQRHARIAGVFIRLNQRDGKPRYLSWLPRVLRQLDQALTDAGLTEIRTFLNTELPGWADAGPALAANTQGA